MTNCYRTIDLEAFVDRECTAEEGAAIDQHLGTCETCAAEIEQLRVLNHAVCTTMPAESAPADLRRRITEQMRGGETAPHRATPQVFRIDRRRFAFATLGAVAAGAAVAVVAPIIVHRRASPEQFASTVISDFETFLFAEQVLDYVDGDALRVANWYSSRLNFSLPRIPSNLSGNRLIGGRLCWLFDRRLAALSFDGSDGPLAFYVMEASDLELPQGRNVPGLGERVSAHQRDRFTNLVWRHGGLAMSLVGQAGPNRMEEIAKGLTKAMGR